MRREDGIFFQLAAKSSENLKPELVMEAFGIYAGITFPEYAFMIHRLELYADTGTEGERKLTALEDLGEEIQWNKTEDF